MSTTTPRDTVPEELEPDPVAALARRAVARLTPAARVSLLAAGLIAAQMIFRTWMTSGSWFMWDDYIFLADVVRGDDDWAWVFQSHFSLFMPISFILVKIVGGAGFSWGVVAAQILVMQLLANLSCWWMLRTVFGNRLRILVPLSFYLFSPMTAPAGVWWSVAINQLPHHIAIFGAIGFHVKYARTGKVRHAFAATALLALGLGSYIKAPLIVLVLLTISVCWFTSGGLRARARTLIRSWPAWLMYAAALGTYVGLWQRQQTASAPRQSCELPGVFSLSLVDSIGTSVVGGPWSWRLWTGGIDPFIASSKCVPQVYKGDPLLVVGGAPQSLLAPPLIGVVLAWIAITGLVLYVWARHRNAILSLWFLVPYAVLSAVLVYLGRAGTFGSQVSAREIRYFSDIAAVAALAIGAAIMPIIGAKQRLETREQPYFRVAIPRRAFAVLGVLCLVGSLVSTVSYVQPWHETSARSFPERAFVQKVRNDLSTRTTEKPVLIADLPLPVAVANPVIYPYNLPSRKLAPLEPNLKAVLAGSDLHVLDAEGGIHEATVTDGPRAETGPVKDCGYLAQNQGVRIPIAPVLNFPFWARMDYLASADGSVTISAGDSSRTVAVEKGLHTMLVQTEGAYDHVNVTASGSLSVCVDNVHVGQLQSKDGGPAS